MAKMELKVKIEELRAFQLAYGKWAANNWPSANPDTICSHFREEAREFAGGLVQIDPGDRGPVVTQNVPASHDPEEAADCVLLLLHHAYQAGYDLMEEVKKKAAINMQREWDHDNPAEGGHIKHKKPLTFEHALNCPAYADRNASCTCEEPEEDS